MTELDETRELQSAVRTSGIAMHLARLDGKCQDKAVKRAMTKHRNKMKGAQSYYIANGIVKSESPATYLNEILKRTTS